MAMGERESSMQNKGGDIAEVNVEDPAPAFEMLRDACDYGRFKQRLLQARKGGGEPPIDWRFVGAFDLNDNDVSDDNGVDGGGKDTKGDKERGEGPNVEDEGYFVPLPDAEAAKAGAELRITPRQVRVVHELLKIESVEAYVLKILHRDKLADVANQSNGEQEESVDRKVEEARKGYRLMVKKNLLKLHGEELGGLASKEERKGRFAELFEETEGRYRSILGIGKPSP